MPKRLIVPHLIAGCSAVLLAFLLNMARVEAKPSHAPVHRVEAQRRSVINYFYLLPSLGIEDKIGRQERRQLLLPKSSSLIDTRHDYLLVHPDSAPAEEVAVFRAHGKSDLIADSSPDFESDYNSFMLYRLRNGRLRDVTRQMLPMPADTDHFLYELPHLGTTIRVFRFSLKKRSRHHVFDLQWRDGRFVKVP